MPAAPNPRNTYTQEEQERNKTLKAQQLQRAAYAARFFHPLTYPGAV